MKTATAGIQIALDVPDALDNELYDEPLSIRSRVIYYDAVPDLGVISLRNSHAK